MYVYVLYIYICVMFYVLYICTMYLEKQTMCPVSCYQSLPISVGFGTLCHKSLLIMSLNIYTIYTHTHTHIYIYILLLLL